MTVGYGYRPWLAGIWLLALILLGTLSFGADSPAFGWVLTTAVIAGVTRTPPCPGSGPRLATSGHPQNSYYILYKSREEAATMSITASEARQNLFPLIEQVNEDHAPVHITSRKGNAVLMSEEDFTSWTETVHLLRSPKNARRLLDSIAEAEDGRTQQRELIDPDAEHA